MLFNPLKSARNNYYLQTLPLRLNKMAASDHTLPARDVFSSSIRPISAISNIAFMCRSMSNMGRSSSRILPIYKLFLFIDYGFMSSLSIPGLRNRARLDYPLLWNRCVKEKPKTAFHLVPKVTIRLSIISSGLIHFLFMYHRGT